VLREAECVVSDDHAGLKKAIQEVLPKAAWQRCYVHAFAIPWISCRGRRTTLPDGVRWMYDRGTLDEARRDLAAWLEK
jgi:putative transposase